LVISGANGTFVDLAEQAALTQSGAEIPVYSPKPALGESVGASGIWQVIAGAQALLTGELPPWRHGLSGGVLRDSARKVGRSRASAVVLDCGLNQQIAGLRLTVKH